MNKPIHKQANLFRHATSELSQDAFICWLLEWAAPEQAHTDRALHDCGVTFIRALFAMHKDRHKALSAPEQIQCVEVKKQHENIDVLCIVNGRYAILIEDKIATENHSDQLWRYFDAVKEEGFDEKNIIPVYFKTIEQSNYEDVKGKGYQPFMRTDMLQVLNGYPGTNAILCDYRDHLQSISDEIASYKTLPISNWTHDSWLGFYLELQNKLDGDWAYVNNPSGGFLGFWWGGQDSDNDGSWQYLQLEEHKLCFKIEVEDKAQQTSLRSKWYEQIKSAGSAYGLVLKKPPRFGKGQYMTVCVLAEEYRASNDEGIIDMDKTLARLERAGELLASLKMPGLNI